MAYSGYPTPDNFEGDADFICIPLIVPNKTEFIAAIYGQYAEMSKEYYWKQVGTMTPETAAFLSSRGLGLTDAYGECDVVDCQDIADCIEVSEAVQEAIKNQTINDNDNFGETNPDYLSPSGTNSTTIINNRFPPAGRAEEVHEPPFECDLDILWAGILFMVQRLDERGRDFLERVTSGADKWQRVAEFIGTVPIVGEIAENVTLAFVNSAEDILNLYNAYSTPEQLEDIACDLFAMVCNECRYPTYDEIADYYANLAIEDMADWANIALKFMVDYLTGSSGLASIVAYYSVVTFQLWVMYAQSTFVGLRGTKWLNIWLDNGEEYANDAWILLCDGCDEGEWIIEFDFLTSNGEFYKNAGGNRGVWVSGEGWNTTLKPSSSTYGIIIDHAMPATCLISEMEVTISMDGGACIGRVRLNDTGSGDFPLFVNFGPTSVTPNCANGVQAGGANNTLIQLILDKYSGTQTAHILSLKARGTGEKPSGYTSDTGVIFSCGA